MMPAIWTDTVLFILLALVDYKIWRTAMVKPPSTPPSSDLEGVNMDVRIGNGADSIWVVKPDRRTACRNPTECRRDYPWTTRIEGFTRFRDAEGRSEERRVGKEGVSPCRYRWSTTRIKKK